MRIQLTLAQLKRVENAARICGWKKAEAPAFARQLLLASVREICRGHCKELAAEVMENDP